MKGQNPECPCGSGQRYRACCRRFHEGDEPEDAVALMRSRYAAYALGEVGYLWRTLDPEHPDRSRPEGEVIRELRAFSQATRFARLRVLDHDEGEAGEPARVLFHAELYQSGKERSFAELSLFRRREDGWRYHSGETRAMRASDPRLESLRIAEWSPRSP